MKRAAALLLATTLAAIGAVGTADAFPVRVRRGPAGRVHVTVRPGFPIRRTLPSVVVRPGPAIRVVPRTYLAPVVFGAAVVTLPPADRQAWSGTESVERNDGWTEFTMNVDRRGDRLLLQIDGNAQISFAEVVFDNGEAQVVDFNDRAQRSGVYSLLDFRNGRKVDHVRIVARSDAPRSDITLRLTT